MHPNPTFRTTEHAAILAFARAQGFGMLTLNGPEGPLAAHVPFVLSEGGAALDLHLARSNPIARAALPGPALLAVQGPDAYISPDWYGPHSQVPDQVPTWNYIAVHLRGTLHPLPPEALEPHLDAISAEQEARLLPKKPWTSTKMSDDAMPRMMRMILPFRLQISDLQGTWKLNQNKSPEVRARAAAALRQRGGQSDAARLADEMDRIPLPGPA
ncbi:FMN-binding negative transcriptional regulator [Pseudotabrizicola alkalilacus]|uniref:FMN-binding negative transcriptional regulator n=1 Tax=Pseudotabrizicola alkalilacus TaxID=2305252 RepID=A0A411Z2Q4_9RHOB|nr:FMN-binding negative transcriptional regulator [Pseudotabrizicola alkalilacus]RGP37347.1 FMN-binding negative transcriptional regulator [Pseudotabrizicola alkalilacus]